MPSDAIEPPLDSPFRCPWCQHLDTDHDPPPVGCTQCDCRHSAIEPPFDCPDCYGRPSSDELEAGAWLRQGIDRGWCSPVVCAMHDGLPMTDDEELEVEDGGDPCIAAVRLW